MGQPCDPPGTRVFGNAIGAKQQPAGAQFQPQPVVECPPQRGFDAVGQVFGNDKRRAAERLAKGTRQRSL